MQKWFKPPSLVKTNLVLARPGSTISPKLQLSSLLDQTKPLQAEVSLGNIFFIYQRGWLMISRSTNKEAKVKIGIHGNGWAIEKLEWMLNPYMRSVRQITYIWQIKLLVLGWITSLLKGQVFPLNRITKLVNPSKNIFGLVQLQLLLYFWL